MVVWALAAILDYKEKGLSWGEKVERRRGLAPGAEPRGSLHEPGPQTPESDVTKQMSSFFQLWSHVACQRRYSLFSRVLLF